MIIFFLFLFAQNNAQAVNFCSRSNDDLLKQFEASENRIGFQNQGGLGNGGVCWWHSRLQRSSIYLTQFDPSLPQPTEDEARTLVHSLIHFSQVVVIPGYANFSDFSKDFEPMIQKELENWQLRDGFIYQQWIRGMMGRSTLPASTLEQHMDQIYQTFLTSKPGLWIMAQMPGITSHALLFIGMTKTDLGYHLRLVDSNYPNLTRELDYRIGDQTIHIGSETFTPYVGFQNDQTKIDHTLQSYCGAN